MRLVAVLIGALCVNVASAKLPPPTDAAKAQATETAAKAAWSDKLAAYKLCLAIDRTAERYRRDAKSAGKSVPEPVATPPCADPGSYASPITPIASKPLEASGAHSPPGTAVSPPSMNATSQQLSEGTKK